MPPVWSEAVMEKTAISTQAATCQKHQTELLTSHHVQCPLDTDGEVYQGQNTRRWCEDYAIIMSIKLTLTTVDLWPLLSQVWQEPVCRPPSSEPRDPPPGTHLSPTAGWCRSLQSPEMQSEFTYKDQICTNISRKLILGGGKKRSRQLEIAGWTQ